MYITHAKKAVAGILAGLLLAVSQSAFTVSVCAMEKPYEVQLSEDGNWIKEGGLNRYCGTVFSSEEQAKETEAVLKRDGYIELKELTDEEYEGFVTNTATGWWFENYIKDADDKKIEYYDEWFKIYVFEPSFRDWWESYEEVGEKANSVDKIPVMEIENSSVVIDYRTWWSKDRVGSDLSNEINDGIPSWYDTGYICITSPIDAEITFELVDDGTFYTVYVTKNTPFRAEFKYGAYHITQINGKELKKQDSNCPLGNNIAVGWGDNLNLETPVDINITKTVEAYNIKPIDLTGKPDRSLDKNQNLSGEEKTTLDEEESEPVEEKKANWFKRILIILLIAAVCAGVGVYVFLDRKRRL